MAQDFNRPLTADPQNPPKEIRKMQHQQILQNDTIHGSHLGNHIDARRNNLDGDWRHSVQGLFFTGPLLSAVIWVCLVAAFWKMFG
jgi:hypothetical protein